MPIRKRGENPKKMESHPAMKKLGIFRRPRSASLGHTPKNQVMEQKRFAPSSPLGKTSKRGKGGSSPSYAQVTTSQPSNKEGDWHVVTKKRKKKKKRKEKKEEEKEKRAEDPARKAHGDHR